MAIEDYIFLELKLPIDWKNEKEQIAKWHKEYLGYEINSLGHGTWTGPSGEILELFLLFENLEDMLIFRLRWD